jgi:RNA polymerase sigma-70 factor (ECF subfamily)
MRIQYKDADGRVLELEVSEDVGRFYLADMDRERKSDRRETRRHTSLSAFNYEDHAYFDSAERLRPVGPRGAGLKRRMDN